MNVCVLTMLCTPHAQVINRSNLAFATIGMAPELGLSQADFGFAAGIFFCSYALMQVPSKCHAVIACDLWPIYGATCTHAAPKHALGVRLITFVLLDV